jgi:hypothetical protein
VPADEVLAEECKGVAEGSVGEAGVFFEGEGRAEGGEGVVGGVHLRVVGERNADCHVGATPGNQLKCDAPSNGLKGTCRRER